MNDDDRWLRQEHTMTGYAWPRPRSRPAPPWPRRYRFATVLWAGDRVASVAADDGEDVDVVVPGTLWPSAGDRVALVRYPYGWVMAGWVRGERDRAVAW